MIKNIIKAKIGRAMQKIHASLGAITNDKPTPIIKAIGPLNKGLILPDKDCCTT